MVEPSLLARSALDDLAKPDSEPRAGQAFGVALAELVGREAVLVLARRGQVSMLRDGLGRDGFALPMRPQRTLGHEVELVWTGPQQWLALAPPAAMARLRAAARSLEAACTLVAFDDARTILSVAGPRARDTLAKMLPVDLHPRAFAPGDAAVTLAGTIATTIWQADVAPTYRLAVPRSLARSFWQWLTASAAEFGYRVEAAPEG